MPPAASAATSPSRRAASNEVPRRHAGRRFVGGRRAGRGGARRGYRRGSQEDRQENLREETMMKRRTGLLCLALALGALPSAALAQYPDKPIRLVIP